MADATGLLKRKGRLKTAANKTDAVAGSKKKAAPAATSVEPGTGAQNKDCKDEAVTWRGMFTKELRTLMYGYGDHETPVKETVDLMEDILAEYVTEITTGAIHAATRAGKAEKVAGAGKAAKAARAAATAGRLFIDEEDILHTVRKDPPKYARVKKLLAMRAIIKDAKMAVDQHDKAHLEDLAALEAGDEPDAPEGDGDAAAAPAARRAGPAPGLEFLEDGMSEED